VSRAIFEDVMDVSTWLQGLGLERHEAAFRDNLIDMDIVRELNENDLEKLGLPLGDRKRVLKAIANLPAPGAAAASPIPGPHTRDEAERRPITVMFCDLVGSTSLASTLDAEDWRDLVGAYLDDASKAIGQYGGHVAKKLGDGLMALFGYPRAQENDAERAARAGLTLLRALEDLNASNAGRGLPALAARIGLDSGPVVVDSTGEVFGDAPNVAARAQSEAEPGTILVTAAVRRQVAGLFVLEDKGPRELKGVPGSPVLYRIVRPSGGGRRTGARMQTRLVGREDDLEVLVKRWQRAQAGAGQFIQIVGEPGLGKSRLIDEFRGRLAETPHSWVEWTSSQLLQNTALHPLVEWGKQRFGGAEVAPESRLADLESSLTQVKLNPVEFAPLLAPLLDIPTAIIDAPELTPDELRRRQLAAMVAWLLAGAHAQPLVLAFEDLHWADPTSLDLLKMLAERGATARLMIVATARPEFRAPWATRSHHGVISLVPLDRQQARQMVGAISERNALSAEAIEGVTVRTGGVPLFIEEVTRLVLEGGPQTIPLTLQQSLAARLDRLGDARDIAQIGAVAGREFAFGLLLAIAGHPEAELNAALEQLVDADLVFVDGLAPDATYRFKHALIQEAAYESMLRSRRREIHAQIAKALMRLHPAIAETAPETLATHLARAGDEAGAAEYWQKAGQLAQRNSAYKEAIGAYQNALQSMRKQDRSFIDVNRAIASAYFAGGEHELNFKHLEAAAAAADASGEPVIMTEIAMQQCHVISQFGGDSRQAVHVGRRALEMANRLEDEALAYGARFALGHAYWICGDYESEIELLSANLPENMRDPTRIRDFGTAGSLLLDSMSILGSTLAHRGQFDKGLPILERAQALPNRNAFDFSVVRFHHARAHLFRGDTGSAAPISRAAIEHASRVGLEFTLPWHQAMLGHAHALNGEFETAVALLEAALERSQKIHTQYLTSFTGELLGETLAPRDPKRALDVAETALGVARASGHRAIEAELLRVKAASLVSIDCEAAEAAAREGLELAEKLGLDPEHGHCLRTLGDIMAAKGNTMKAEELHGLAHAKFQSLGMKRWAETPWR
jgi:class 3 adenylate cyclase/tetratricopeptide (TPR) repeat protein